MKKFKKTFLLSLVVVLLSGCSCNKSNLINENNDLIKENVQIQEQINDYKEKDDIFDYYNKITTKVIPNIMTLQQTSNSLVTSTSALLVARNGNNYILVVDYNAFNLTNGYSYVATSSRGIEYSVRFKDNKILGLGLIEARINNNQEIIDPIEIGTNISEINAYISSSKQFNKVQLTNKVKSSTIEDNNTTYNTYIIENEVIDGGILINYNLLALGIYASSIDAFVSTSIINDLIAINY